VSGNLFIKNATLTIIGPNSTISSSPSTYDTSYSTLALLNTDNANAYQVSMVSRGLVFYSPVGTKIGSLVRSPGGAYLELECTVGGGYVLINGANGVRSDKGYLVGSARMIDNVGNYYAGNGAIIVNASAQATFAFVTGTGGVNVGASGSYQVNGTQVIDSSRNINCASVAVSGSVGAASFNSGGGTGQTMNPVFDGNGGTSAWQLDIRGGVVVGITQVR
jgi:hypothetical protein